MADSPTLLIPGGAGFIGSNFVRFALQHTTMRVVVVDKLTYAGNLASLDEVAKDPRFVFIREDISDGEAMSAVYEAYRPRWVVNFAAETHVDRSIDGPRAFVQTNLLGAFELLEASRRHLRSASDDERARFRFLHVSTDEVYGSLGPTGAFVEDSPYAPNSPYSATKAGADHLARAYFATYGLPVCVTNCSNNYGPFQFPEKLIPLTLMNALEGRPLPIYGDGSNVRDWLYVEDHCAGLLRVLQVAKPGSRYNFGGECERTNLSLVEAICGVLEELAPVAGNAALRSRGVASYASLKTFVADRPGHDHRYAIDPSLARRELGWEPRFDITRGLRETVGWYLANRDWCTTVQQGKYDRERLGLEPRTHAPVLGSTS
ncbi:MAG: dTDP-glucose 4,6-dehydratase [Labilithrix sp.]